jgi:hypothetical protein
MGDFLDTPAIISKPATGGTELLPSMKEVVDILLQ